jgi:OMF family outer membrane factor
MKKLVNIHKLLRKEFLIFFWIFSGLNSFSQEEKVVNSLPELLQLSKEKNYALQNATLQTQLANLTKKTAVGNILNPRIPASAQSLNNFEQQVSFLPGTILGLPEGTFKEVTMGQQYTSTFSVQPQFDILNFGSIAQVKSAKINEQLVDNQNKINEQNIYNQINGVYFNLLAFEVQKKILQENIKIGENLVLINQNKFNEGITRKQDINEAEANLIALQDKLSQLILNEKIQNQSLALFLENEFDLKLTEQLSHYENIEELVSTNSNFKSENYKLQYQMMQQDLKIARLQQLPVLSFISSFNWQNLSNENYFDANSNWVNFNYVGLKVTWDFPTNVQKLATVYNKKIQLNQLKNSADHADKENVFANKQLEIEYEKAIEQFKNLKKIYVLKKDTYEKNFNQYQEQILPLDKLLISQNDLLISEINMVNALANIGFSKNKIVINNN